MKICAIIAEYNPLHLGHLKHIEYVKSTLGAEKIIVFMSGNFTQRGEVALLDKFTRARHAVLAGADMVIELPTVFAIGNAETFATGAVNLILSCGIIDGICFGVESGTKEEYLSLAKAMLNESKEFKKALKAQLDKGISLAKAKFEAVKETYKNDFNPELVNSPNNVLGLEYVKAILKNKSDVNFFIMHRDGDHNDKTLKKGITSATSIRETVKTGKFRAVKKCVPPFVFRDIDEYPHSADKLYLSKILTTSVEDIAKAPDCTEGLENRIKAFSKDSLTLYELVEKVSTKRYTKTRVQRILSATLLGVTSDFVKDCLNDKLYLKILAVNSSAKDLIPHVCERAKCTVLTRKSDVQALKKTAEKCFKIDALANDIYGLVKDKKTNEYQMLII